MTSPTGPPGPYQMPPTQPPAVATGRKVSPAGYWIGGGILVVGCGIAIVWFVVAIVGLVNAPDDFVRIGVPGSEVVTLSDGDWIVYYESGSTRSYAWAPPSVDVTGPNGRAINVQYSTDSYSYSVDGSDGEALYQFHASTSGAYTIEASTVGEPGLRSDDQIAIGRPVFDGGRVGGILGSLALGAVSFLVGLVILIVTIVRRSRSRRPAYVAYQPPYGGGPPTGGPYYGGPPPAPGGWAPPTSPPAPGGPPPAPGSSPWPAPGATPPSPGEPSAAPPPTPSAPPWPAPDNRPPSG